MHTCKRAQEGLLEHVLISTQAMVSSLTPEESSKRVVVQTVATLKAKLGAFIIFMLTFYTSLNIRVKILIRVQTYKNAHNGPCRSDEAYPCWCLPAGSQVMLIFSSPSNFTVSFSRTECSN